MSICMYAYAFIYVYVKKYMNHKQRCGYCPPKNMSKQRVRFQLLVRLPS